MYKPLNIHPCVNPDTCVLPYVVLCDSPWLKLHSVSIEECLAHVSDNESESEGGRTGQGVGKDEDGEDEDRDGYDPDDVEESDEYDPDEAMEPDDYKPGDVEESDEYNPATAIPPSPLLSPPPSPAPDLPSTSPSTLHPSAAARGKRSCENGRSTHPIRRPATKHSRGPYHCSRQRKLPKKRVPSVLAGTEVYLTGDEMEKRIVDRAMERNRVKLEKMDEGVTWWVDLIGRSREGVEGHSEDETELGMGYDYEGNSEDVEMSGQETEMELFSEPEVVLKYEEDEQESEAEYEPDMEMTAGDEEMKMHPEHRNGPGKEKEDNSGAEHEPAMELNSDDKVMELHAEPEHGLGEAEEVSQSEVESEPYGLACECCGMGWIRA
ncbi:hypothetical protein EDC01DRAFT_634561 [Geopyxis carbonaria]|nr:hypothetical protein EDC01DRAFT_634561 [Geopyxis carbonaria]